MTSKYFKRKPWLNDYIIDFYLQQGEGWKMITSTMQKITEVDNPLSLLCGTSCPQNFQQFKVC